MVDAADPEKIEASKNELHNLLDKPQLQGIPVRSSANFPTESSSQLFDDMVFSSMCSSVYSTHTCQTRGPRARWGFLHFTLCGFYIIFGYIRVIYSVLQFNLDSL